MFPKALNDAQSLDLLRLSYLSTVYSVSPSLYVNNHWRELHSDLPNPSKPRERPLFLKDLYAYKDKSSKNRFFRLSEISEENGNGVKDSAFA